MYHAEYFIRVSLEHTDSWNTVSDKIFKKIANENKLNIDTLKVIYQKVMLWRSNQ